MLVYFVRHGETVDNIVTRLQTPETQLSPEGEAQAAIVAERLKDVPFDHLFSSPFVRAKVTAEAINLHHRLPIEEDDDLREIIRPTSIRGRVMGEPGIEEIYPYILEKHLDPHLKHEDGESFVDLVERANTFLSKLEKLSTQQPQATVCVVAHGIYLKALLLRLILGKDIDPDVLLKAIFRLKLSNTALSLVKIENNEWMTLSIGDYSHL